MKVLIDADYLLYSCGFASEGEPISHACRLLKNKLNQTLEESKCDEYQVYIDGKGNFREEIAVDYKANRKSIKPTNYPEMREYLKKIWGAIEVDGMEVDDVVSLLLWEDFVKHEGQLTVLSSPDKDLKNTPGWHHNIQKGTLTWITEVQATRHFYYQLLMGDAVDNIRGLPYACPATKAKYKLKANQGFGKVSAKAIMDCSLTIEQAREDVYLAYIEYGLDAGWSESQTKEYLLQQAQLLWMVRELTPTGKPVMYEIDGEAYDRAYKRRTTYSPGYETPSDLNAEIQGGEG